MVLHTSDQPEKADRILRSFRDYADSLDIEVDLNRRYDVGPLSFVAVKVPKRKIADLAKFSFMRTAREMPSLRQLRPGTKP